VIKLNKRLMIRLSLAALICLFAAALVPFLSPWTPWKLPLPAGQRLSYIEYSIRYQYEELGLPLPNKNEYLNSVFGKPAIMLDKGLPARAGWASDLSLHYNRKDGYVRQITSVKIQSKRLFVIPYCSNVSIGRIIIVNKAKQTCSILESTSAGTKYWKEVVASMPDPNRAFPGSKKLATPKASFDLPADAIQLDSYKEWVGRVVGSKGRLRDGWGHHIKLTLDNKSNPALLIASSAGPDGKWDTIDDMSVKRNTKTGKIVTRIGIDGVITDIDSAMDDPDPRVKQIAEIEKEALMLAAKVAQTHPEEESNIHSASTAPVDGIS
jgi:hypothetical protein